MILYKLLETTPNTVLAITTIFNITSALIKVLSAYHLSVPLIYKLQKNRA